MNNYSIYLPSYTIGTSSYDSIERICSPYGSKIIAIGGKRAMEAAKPYLDLALEASKLMISDYLWYGGEASYENVEALSTHPLVQDADMIFAIGGGKALDTCKALSIKLHKPIFTFPTIASTCAACTTVSIMYRPDGSFIEPYFFDIPPVHTFIHTAILAAAPSKYLWAGIGDTYAKYYEASISGRNEELVHYNALGICMSRMCVDPLLQYGAKAYQDNVDHHCSYELEQTILAIIVTTAIVSILVTKEHTADYNSGLAHAIFYALTSFKEIEEHHLHGEVVGFGVLILLLVDQNIDEFKKIYELNKSIGLPVSLEDINITESMLQEILPIITKMPDLRHYPYNVSVEMLQDAFDRLNNFQLID